MVRVLVLGGAGQVGLALGRAERPAEWTLALPTRSEVDLASGEGLEAAVADADLVINPAAYTAVDKAESEPDLAFAVNRDGPARLAKLCAVKGIPLLHVSTDYVFDGTKAAAYRETDPTAPLGVYGRSKCEGEQAVAAALSQHVILRTAWVYGPDRGNFVKTMLRVGAERDRLTVVDDQHGCPTAAADIADALIAIGKAVLAGKGTFGVYHFVGAGETTWYGFAQEIFAQAGARGAKVPEVVPISTAGYPTPAKRPANSVLDCGAIARDYGLAAPNWKKSLAKTLDVLLTNQASRS